MEFLASILSVITLISYIEMRIKKELRPNGGSSVKDQLNRLEDRVNTLYENLIDKGWHRKQSIVRLHLHRERCRYDLLWIYQAY